ncbi:MAG: endonuclease/exonuclease/phosphatase family protein [Gammaproteobacteria bacterium]|nr:endonuclease/exonuclease/phosphatase family protein [Gammaproteobacteria bacterium]NIR83837.1 endonuclease/exonuclease/phosphatase family protein [Gammaproteobacteria bacterium]NIR88341.1 endonuclease/exonuclease/phosphatase family protein [Gammaproteobacteria bacterium]NIU05160.1 endonuclease/exonuclease/phosphatase family protein [Gammaproteobacteria bacterium]NIV51990.1 endonuclease [Gammaproteobacteria bacterium]
MRRQLHTDVGRHRSESSLLLATWNIRDFDANKFGHGRRLPESLHYIAEIISAFDLVAIQEVNRDLRGLHKVMGLLGGAWDYIVTDTTEGRSGNEERMAFVYDRRKVLFRNLAGEIVLPRPHKIVVPRGGTVAETDEDELQFARTPFVVAFQAGWFKFNLCTVHIYYGADYGDRLQRRISEIGKLAQFFDRRQRKEKEDYVLLGDFNIVSPAHATMQSLEAEGFVIPEHLKREKTNLKGDKHYDQIALKVREKRLEVGASGVLQFEKSVFRNNDFTAYFDQMPADKRDHHYRGSKQGQPRTEREQREYYRDEWRTWQLSDHLPMWVELKVDFTNDYLKSLMPGRTPLAD